MPDYNKCTRCGHKPWHVLNYWEDMGLDIFLCKTCYDLKRRYEKGIGHKFNLKEQIDFAFLRTYKQPMATPNESRVTK